MYGWTDGTVPWEKAPPLLARTHLAVDPAAVEEEAHDVAQGAGEAGESGQNGFFRLFPGRGAAGLFERGVPVVVEERVVPQETPLEPVVPGDEIVTPLAGGQHR